MELFLIIKIDWITSAFGEEEEELRWEYCNGIFIEEIDVTEEVDDPRKFEPYSIVDLPNETGAQSNSQNMSNDNQSMFSLSYTPGSGAQAIHIIHSNMRNGPPQSNGMVGSLLNMLSNMLNGGEDLYEGGMTFDQILQHIIQNDPNRYGPPPASKNAVEKLPKGTYAQFFPKDEESKEDDK